MYIDSIDDYSTISFSNFEPSPTISIWNGKIVDIQGISSVTFPNMKYTQYNYRFGSGRDVEIMGIGGRVEKWDIEGNFDIDQEGKASGGIKFRAEFGPKKEEEKSKQESWKTPEQSGRTSGENEPLEPKKNEI